MPRTALAIALAGFLTSAFAADPPNMSGPITPAQAKLMQCANEFSPKIADGGADTLIVSAPRTPGAAKPAECGEVKVTGWEVSETGTKFEDVAKTTIPGVQATANGTLTVKQGDKALHFHPLLTDGNTTFPGHLLSISARPNTVAQQGDVQYFGPDGKLLPPGSPRPPMPPPTKK